MPFNVSTRQTPSLINSNPIHPHSSIHTSPEIRLWQQMKAFFDPIQESDAQGSISNILHPPSSTTREALVNQFEQLRMFAYPGYKDNIRLAQYGEEHYRILGENGQEILSVNLDNNGTYKVEYEGRKIRHSLAPSQQESGVMTENAAEDPAIAPVLTAEECEAIWSAWEPSQDEYQYIEKNSNINEEDSFHSDISTTTTYTQMLKDRIEVVNNLRCCLQNHSSELYLFGLDTLNELPEALPPCITELNIHRSQLLKLPPLPPALQTLKIFDVPLDSLPVLPKGLKTLILDEIDITQLPRLPLGLETLNIIDMPQARLPILPQGLQQLKIDNLWLTQLPTLPNTLTNLTTKNLNISHLPTLPDTLQTLNISNIPLIHLPELPPTLQELYINNIPLTYLPELPPTLQELHINNMPLTHLPELPPTLQTLHVSKMSLTHLPELPHALQTLDIGHIPLHRLPRLPNRLINLIANGLINITHLPTLPLGLQKLFIYSMSLGHLPPLPPTLRRLVANNAPLISGLEDVANLSSTARISLGGTTLSARMLQTLRHLTSEPDYSGPQINFNMVSSSLPREARALHLAIADWVTPAEEEATALTDKWQSFAQENHSTSFSLFLDRLSDTQNFRNNSAFKAQISSWLMLLAEDAELRAKTFTMATDSTSSCEDRVTLAMNQMKRVQLVHQVEKGLFDTRIPELVAVGREMFRLEKLEVIAREKTNSLRLVDEIEVWLGYQNQLKAPLGLTSVTAEMRFFDVSGISQSDLQVAEAQVKSAENSQFPTWILQWAPLHSLLQRTDSAGWQALAEKRGTDYEIHYQTLSDTELKPANLIGNTEAERTIGARAMASAEDNFLEGLRVLTDPKLTGHLEKIWP